MHLLAGAHAAPHCWQVPSPGFAHCLYVRSPGSNMQAPGGVHAGPKWKHMPAPLLVHVKYVPTPAWNTHELVGHPMSFTETGPVGAEPPPPPVTGGVTFPGVPGVTLVPVGPVCAGLGDPPHAARTTTKASRLTTWARTRWL